MKKHLGFTIIELMITIAVIGIGLAIGVPAMNQFVLDNRLVSQINTLNSSLALARSEAVKQNETTVVCVSADGATCTAGANWNEGWIVFVDRSKPPPFVYAAGAGTGCNEDSLLDCLVAIEAQVAGSNTLVAHPSVPGYISFNGSGVARCNGDCDTNTTYFTLCDQRGAAHARALAISRTGRSSSIKTNPEGGSLVCP